MIFGGTGGGATISGSLFENGADICGALQKKGYSVEILFSSPAGASKAAKILNGTDHIADYYKGKALYTKMLEPMGVDWRSKISQKLLPDHALYDISKKEIHIIECKYQDVEGSVDEKLQTCDFKKKQYIKLFSGLGIGVRYTYVLSKAFFDKPKFKDVYDYMETVGCEHYFDAIPLNKL